MGDSAQLYTIAPGQPFLKRLAETLYDDDARQKMFGACALHEAHILLPTRRAARQLAHEFLILADEAGQGALLLPRIDTLGDLDEDAPHIGGQNEPDPLAVPPAIEPMARHFHLLKLVRAWAAASGHMEGGNLNPVKLSALAFELEAFLDQAQNEQIDWAELPSLVPDELAKNWQQTLEFLKIITQFWPAHLAETGCLDPTDRRNVLLLQRCAQWAASAPAHPVIAAGSTGSIRATADLLSVIARLPRGTVVFPGLDNVADAGLWKAIEQDVSHPQYGMAQTLIHMQCDRDLVKEWPHYEPHHKQDDKRSAILHRALVPAAITADWATQTPPDPQALDGLHMIDAPDARSEAGVIALIMREVLESDTKSAALVTRDRKLARRVAGELRRWDIAVDDSAGKPLANGPVSVWLRHILTCLAEDFAPVALLSLLKHPKTCLAENRAAHMQIVHQVEAAVLRGVRPTSSQGDDDLGGLKAALTQIHEYSRYTDIADAPHVADFLARLTAAFEPLRALPFEAHMDAHIAALGATAEKLLADEDALFADDEEGRALATLLERLSSEAGLAGAISKADWPNLFDMWLSRQPLRAQGPTHKRLAIWGPLEARLMQADVMILGGLNETVWPPMPETGPWLSRPMRAALGMSQPERQIGLAAHDFVQGAAAPVVYLTRAAKIDNAPSVAARWLRRLETLSGKAPRHEQARLLDWWRRLDHADEISAEEAPAPCPPVAARPTRLSVTQIETLLHNPYEIYARKILDLNAWEAVDAPHHAGHRGTLIHAVLEKLVEEGRHKSSDLAAAMLETAAELQNNRPGSANILAYWQARLAAMGEWLEGFEAARRADLRDSFVEVSGRVELPMDGVPFSVTAKADRIDRLQDGRFDIIDYKTGAVPSQKAVRQHLAPQLTLEAAILQHGGFEKIGDGGPTRRLGYVHLTGRQPAGKAMEIECDNELTGGVLYMVERLIAGYRQETRPYHVHLRERKQGMQDPAFDHLARLKEWRSDGEGDDG